MPGDRPERVWYAAYGANASAASLRSYLEGAAPPGAASVRPGCRDSTFPVASIPVRIPYRLFFAGGSCVWTGGVAFVDPEPVDPPPTLARAWLITAEQFDDIVAQESGRSVSVDPPTTPVDLTSVMRDGTVDVAGGRYDLILRAGDHDGVPMVTFTTPRSLGGTLTPPAPPYLRLIAEGLSAAWKSELETLATYFAGQAGIIGARTVAEINAALEPLPGSE